MQQTDIRLLLKRLLLGLAIIALALIGYQIYLNSHFRLVSTSPKTSGVSTDSPFLKVNFNRQLTSSGLSVSSKPNIIKSVSTSGKVLTIYLNYPLNSTTTYSLYLNDVSDIRGDTIRGKTLSFKPKYVPYSALSADQKMAQLQNQTSRTPSKDNISFSGLDSLTNYGITSGQLADLQQAVFLYSKSAKSAIIDTKSISPIPHDPTSASRSDSINFNISIDS